MACDDKAGGGSSKGKMEVFQDGSKRKLIDDSGCHAELSNESREVSTPGGERAAGDAPQLCPSEGGNYAQSKAVSPTGNGHEEDEEILATMGFSGFGH